MTPHASLFDEIVPCSTSVITADGGRLRATGKGVVFLPIDDDQARLLPLSEVLLVPGLDFNLVSVYQLNQEQLRVEFTEELEAEITDPFYHGWKVTARWSKESQAYLVPVVRDKEHAFTASMMEYDDESDDGSDEASDDEEVATPVSDNERLRLGEMWHERLGHIGKSMLPTLAKNSVGLPELFAKRKNCGVSSCETCSLTNIKRSPFPDSTTKTTRPLELVHADLTGRIITKSLGGAEYLAVLVDDHTRMVWVLPLARKSDFADKFIEWRDEVVPHKGPIGTLRTDGGGEFNNWAIKAALSGARHEKSCAYTAQQNGVAERHVGIIKTIMRPLLHARNLPLVYWAEAASTAAYLRNHRPSRPLGGKTPFELWYGTPPHKAREHSLSARARVGVFIGYDKYSKGYRVHFPDTGALAISRNVDFHEDKGYNFNTLVPEPTTITTPDVVVQSASRPPGTRPRLVVIGPRPPPAPPSPKIVEIELSGPAAPAPAPDINSFKSSFAKRFKMKDQGEIGQFLGINIERSPDGTSFLISQAAYIKSMLARFGFEHLKPAPSPLDSKQRLVPYEGQASEADTKLFQSMVGCLMWLSQASRADLAYAVAALARHAKNPGPIHLGCAKRVMRYVAGTIDFKLRIASHSEEDIVAHSDADLGGDHSAKSTSGWCISVHGATVAWGSKLQTLVADSTAQAELIAVWQTAREVLAIQHLLEDLGLRSTDAGPPSVIYCDNQPAIHIITNPVSNGLSRHIERKYLSTREHQERGLVKVQYINTRVNPADVFTKPLAPATFIQHRGTLGINNHHQSTST
ncbi:unnamed protein product [Tilletia caries]|uniref:Integrase catalytic domain-containing protein n=1 Tax=Tilletia caries TaxID=13290 RepID=A0ABN7JB68_9BASI|nr:unnamed protein product [Tilletia caries]